MTSGYQYKGVDINKLVKAGNTNAPTRYSKLPQRTGSVVSKELYKISKFEYTDQGLNLAHYYMPFTIELKTGTNETTISNDYTYFRAILIGGGGGGGGGGGVHADDGHPDDKRDGAGGGGGGAGGMYLLTSSQTIPSSRKFTYTVGTGGVAGGAYTNVKEGSDTSSTKGGDGTSSSLKYGDTTITANNGSGGNFGKHYSHGRQDTPKSATEGNGGAGGNGNGYYVGKKGGNGATTGETGDLGGGKGEGSIIYNYDSPFDAYGTGGAGGAGRSARGQTGVPAPGGSAGGSGYIAIYLFRE